MKIVVTNKQGFTPEQEARLNSLGDVTYFDTVPESGEEYLKRVEGADIICSGTAGLQDVYDQLRNVYVTVGFVSVAFVDLDVMRKNGVQVSNAPGANLHAVSEWIIWMTLTMMRKFDTALNRTETYRKNGELPKLEESLADKKVAILGAGNIGTQVGRLVETFGAEANFFRRGNDLLESVKDADIIIDTLSSNSSTEGILDKEFFQYLKKGSYFITVSRAEITDQKAMLEALDNDTLAGVATDCGGVLVGDTEDPLYQRMLAHPRVYATPHIAYSATKSFKRGNDIMIDNVEAYIKGSPQNILNP